MNIKILASVATPKIRCSKLAWICLGEPYISALLLRSNLEQFPNQSIPPFVAIFVHDFSQGSGFFF
jgi:hypothetical protein